MGRGRTSTTTLSPPSPSVQQCVRWIKVRVCGAERCWRWARGAPPIPSRGAPHQAWVPTGRAHCQESVNPAAFEVESSRLSSLQLPGNCQPCREIAVLFWKLALAPPTTPGNEFAFFPQLQISPSSLAASAPSAAPAQRAHCSRLAPTGEGSAGRAAPARGSGQAWAAVGRSGLLQHPSTLPSWQPAHRRPTLAALAPSASPAGGKGAWGWGGCSRGVVRPARNRSPLAWAAQSVKAFPLPTDHNIIKTYREGKD